MYSQADIFFRQGRTFYTSLKAATNAITFEVHDGKGQRLKDWTHGQANKAIEAEGSSVTDSEGNQLSNIKIEGDEIPKQFLGTRFTFPIYPQEINRTQAYRAEVLPSVGVSKELQPKGHVEQWGLGVPQWSLKGHTGYGTRRMPLGDESISIDGYMAFVALFNFFENYAKENVYRIKTGKPLVQLLFYNHADGFQDFWYVEPKDLPSKQRIATAPLLYNYSMQFIGVRPYTSTEKIEDEIAKAVGNPDYRKQKIAESMQSALDSLTGIVGMARDLSNTLDDIVEGAQSIVDTITAPINAVSDYINVVNEMVDSVEDFKNDLWDTLVGEPISALYGVLNSVNQLQCGLKTLGALPYDYFGDLSGAWDTLLDNTSGSGCGTTLATSSQLDSRL